MDYFDLNTLNPYVRSSWYNYDIVQGRVYGPKMSFDHEIIYVNSGCIHLTIDKKLHICQAGDFLFIPPAMVHTVTPPDTDSNYSFLHFDPVYSSQSHLRPFSCIPVWNLDKYDQRLVDDNIFGSFPFEPILKFKDREAAEKLYFYIVKENARSSLPAHDIVKEKFVMLQLLHMLIADNFPDFYATCTPREINMAARIKSHIDDGNFNEDLHDLEKQFSFSRFYMEKQFKKEYNTSIMAYRNQKRMETARELLRNNTVGHVAEQLGYSSIFVFSRAFKNHYGYTPLDVKKQNQQ